MPTKPAKFTESRAHINAFNPIARACVPFFDTKYGFFSDLVHDAEYAADIAPESRFYLTVRSMGTWVHKTKDEAMDHLRLHNDRAVIEVRRGKYDDFKADVIFTRETA